jgi:hypothetical protein
MYKSRCGLFCFVEKFLVTRLIAMMLSVCISCLMLVPAANADGPPSKLAKGMDGALGTFDFKPKDWRKGATTWWKDTDGISPSAAGCHIGYKDDKGGGRNGRTFGEACNKAGLLVESNPGAGQLHSHKDDIGHPDTFDCKAWCSGLGFTKGVCKPVTGPPPCAKSAKCACS